MRSERETRRRKLEGPNPATWPALLFRRHPLAPSVLWLFCHSSPSLSLSFSFARSTLHHYRDEPMMKITSVFVSSRAA